MPRENLVTYRNLYPNQKHKAILSVDELGYKTDLTTEKINIQEV